MVKKIIIVLFQEKVDGWYHHARYFSEADDILYTYRTKGTKPLNFLLALSPRGHHLTMQSEYSVAKRGKLHPIKQRILKLIKGISKKKVLHYKLKTVNIKEKNIILVNIDADPFLNAEQLNDVQYFEIFFPANMGLNRALNILVSKVKQV